MRRFFTFLDSNFNLFILIFLNISVFLYIGLAIAAPIAKFLGFDAFSDFIYFVYSFLCHQKPERSFLIFENQMAFCVRDLFIFIPFLIIGIVSFFPKIRLRKISLVCLFSLSLPIVFDGGTQFFSGVFSVFFDFNKFYESTNFLRFLTGALFGTGLGLYFFPVIQNGGNFDSKNCYNKVIFFVTFLLSFLVFIFFIYFEKFTTIDFWPPG